MADAENDVVILGAGVGGLLAGARLARAGWTPLVLEASDRLGGRFSTIHQDGFCIPTGAIAIAEGGGLHASLIELGIEAEIRFPDPPLRVMIRGRRMNTGAPAWDFMMKSVTKAAGRVAKGLRSTPDDEVVGLTIEEWCKRHTRSKTVQTLIEGVTRNLFTANANEVPAHLFFRNLRDGATYNSFGFAPRGNDVIADAIADDIRSRRGEVRTGWEATELEVQSDRVIAVRARDAAGDEHRVPAAAVVSNVGPIKTAAFLSDSPYADEFAERVQSVEPTSMLALSFSTPHDHVPDCPGMLNFTDTDRLCAIGNLTARCPELAPEGRTLYEAYAVPRPSVGGNFDVDDERTRMEADLHKVFPWFGEADVIHFKVMRWDNPALRCGPVENPTVTTPLVNLVDVGDGVRRGAYIGTSASAMSAVEAVEALGAPRSAIGAV